MEDSGNFYVCDICHRRIPTINRLLHSTRCSVFNSDLAPAAPKLRNASSVHLPPACSPQSARRSIPIPSAPTSSSVLPFWECQQCTFHNTNFDDLECEICGISRSVSGGEEQSFEQEQQTQLGTNHHTENEPSQQSCWECEICTCLNNMQIDNCQACDHPRPPRSPITERLIPINDQDDSLFVEAEAAYPQNFIDAESMEPDIFFGSARTRNSYQRSAPSAIPAPPSAGTSALYGAGAGAALAWMRGESITRGAITGAGIGLTTGVLLNELSEMTRHVERMNHASVGIDLDRHGGGTWDRDRDAERNSRLMIELRTLLEALPIDMLGRMASNEQRGIDDEQLAELPNHTFTATTAEHATSASSSSSGRTATAPPQECAVCLQAYTSGEQIRTLPCFHQFHTQCVDQWLRMNAKCPICKTSATHS
jgi:hypothetical protein